MRSRAKESAVIDQPAVVQNKGKTNSRVDGWITLACGVHTVVVSFEAAAVLQAEAFFTFAKTLFKGIWAKIVRKERKA